MWKSSMTASKVNVPAAEDWSTGDKVTMEEHQSRRGEALSLGEDRRGLQNKLLTERKPQ